MFLYMYICLSKNLGDIKGQNFVDLGGRDKHQIKNKLKATAGKSLLCYHVVGVSGLERSREVMGDCVL